MNGDFGIVLTTYSGDFYLTKGLLASIHKFMPQTPICIIQDGDFSLDEVKKVYNITHVIKKQDVKNDFLREMCMGSRCSNLVAFWEAPFKLFLYLDSDVVLWGNILKHIELGEFDFICNEPHEVYTDLIYKEQYFDAELLFNYTEYFDWKSCHFFNSGVYIARKNIFDFDEFQEIVNLWHYHRDIELLPTDPQSILNVLVFRNKLKNKIRVAEAHLQTVVPVIDRKNLETTFAFSNGEPIVKKDTVIHWAGTKPLMMNKKTVFISPENYFRKLHLKNIKSWWYYFPLIYFYYEEYISILNRYHKGSVWVYFRSKLNRL